MPVRQLSETIVNRIAAGEVVERPASVVKELVENALDAGASRIDVLTDGGGRRLIRVTDDGEGMTRADLTLAVERHATSKLADDDLVAIATLGFRGEALPSIGAVARLSIATRHTAEPHAWSIEVDAGVKSELKPAALGEGTRVEVRDLFYATPARLKFLKLDRTEAEAVREMVRRLAMSRPDVAFTLAGEERAPVTFAATLPGATGPPDPARRRARRRLPRQRGRDRGRTRGRDGRGLCRIADAHARQCARPISLRQRPAGARQASPRRGARGLRRLSAARPPSAGRSVRDASGARGRRQCAPRQSRSALSQRRAGARPDRPRAQERARPRRAAARRRPAAAPPSRRSGRPRNAAGTGGDRRRGRTTRVARIRSRAPAALPRRRKPHSRSARRRLISARRSLRTSPPKPPRLLRLTPRRSIIRSGRRARRCMTPISWRKRATAWSSSTSTPPTNASSMRSSRPPSRKPASRARFCSSRTSSSSTRRMCERLLARAAGARAIRRGARILRPRRGGAARDAGAAWRGRRRRPGARPRRAYRRMGRNLAAGAPPHARRRDHRLSRLGACRTKAQAGRR